jgi:hypothetical protein
MIKKLISIFIFTLIFTNVYAEKFEFKYVKGDTYRILSTVHEDVFVNGRLNHQAEIINRISVEVTDVTEDGSGIHKANFMTSENSVGNKKVSSWVQEYNSIFTRSKNGTYDIADEFFMPVVRDVPVFPDRDLKPGDSWQCEGHEAHDLRQTFNINTPYKVPFTAYYTYQGETEKDGQKLHIIKATYNLYFTSPTMDSFTTNSQNGYFDYPISTMGYSDQTIYLDENIWIPSTGELQTWSVTKNSDRYVQPKYTVSGGSGYWWTRSTYSTYEGWFRMVHDTGYIDMRQGTVSLGIALAFCT